MLAPFRAMCEVGERAAPIIKIRSGSATMATYPTSPRSTFLTSANSHTHVFLDNDSDIDLSETEALAFQTA